MITVNFTEAEAQALADRGRVKKPNPGQVIELYSTEDRQPRAAIYVYRDGDKLTEEAEDEIADSIAFNPDVIYIDHANALKLAHQLIKAAELAAPASA